MRDFTKQRREIKFKIDDDVFEVAPALPAGVLMDFATDFQKLDKESGEDQKRSMMTILETVLVAGSYQRFTQRMQDRLQPIDLEQVNDVIEWIMEEYGMRPTEPSEDSSGGQPGPASGTPSTENTPDVASISSDSPLISS